ncbi:MAG TPA: MFS transporter [Steroidobacteraceae bacterium]|nr:MFS transporter [Steroidobacteraceae bacterium]
MNTDPREVLARARMGWLQVWAVVITIGLNALDGFDVLSIAFASPGIAAEWHPSKTALGWLQSMELAGMALGSILLGGLADKIGRRATILGCLVVMSAGMFLATTATGIEYLSVYRVLTGLGIGGTLAAINAVAAEFSNARTRNLSVSIMSIGYPIGAVVGGIIVTQLLKGHDWRTVFYFGCVFTALFIPLVLWLVPESVPWLIRKQPAGALEKVNRTLRRMGHAAVESLPAVTPEVRQRSSADIFRPALIATTLIVTAAYFFHVMSFYYVAKWTPKIVVDMGFTQSQGSAVLTWANVGGMAGGALLGLLSLRFEVKRLTIGVMLLGAFAVGLFGRSAHELGELSLLAAFALFCTNAGIVGMYAIFAHVFPTHVRSSGTGFAIGVGRGGSVLGPPLAGWLFDQHYSLPTVSMVLALGTLVAAGILSALQLKPDQPAADHDTVAAGPVAGAQTSA